MGTIDDSRTLSSELIGRAITWKKSVTRGGGGGGDRKIREQSVREKRKEG